jgi:hypothetical protein
MERGEIDRLGDRDLTTEGDLEYLTEAGVSERLRVRERERGRPRDGGGDLDGILRVCSDKYVKSDVSLLYFPWRLGSYTETRDYINTTIHGIG